MGRPRSVNRKIKDLPRGFRQVEGKWYWRPTDKATRLIADQLKEAGISTSKIKTPVEARRWWESHVSPKIDAMAPDEHVSGAVEELLRRYESDELPSITKPSTKVGYEAAIKVLRQEFGKRAYAKNDTEIMGSGNVLRPPELTTYLKKNSHRKNAAKKEVSLLGRVFRLAISRWGLTSFNPCADIEYPSTPPRDKYIDDETYIKMRDAASPVLRCMMDVSSQTGARRGMVLDIRVGDIQEEYLVMRVNKQRGRNSTKPAKYAMTPDLKEVLGAALAIRSKQMGGANLKPDDYLFVTRNGRPYTGESIKRLWKTMRDKMGLVGWEITFHDIRAKAASDSGSLEEAQHLLAHTDPKITQRVYRRKIEAKIPLRAVGSR